MSLTTHGDRSGMTEPKMVTPMLSFVPKREDEDEDEEVRFRQTKTESGADHEAFGATAAVVPINLGQVRPPNALKFSGNLAQNWRDWLQLWRSYEIVTRLRHCGDDEIRVASFVTSIGSRGQRVYNSLPFRNDAERQNMDRVIELFTEYCSGASNVIYDRFLFNRRQQGVTEPFDVYLTSLREFVSHCQFGHLTDELLCDRIVCGIHDSNVRKQLLQNKALTITSCIDMCRASESTTQQVKEMSEPASKSVHAMLASGRRSYQQKSKPKSSNSKKKSQGKDGKSGTTGGSVEKGKCANCGLQHEANREKNCPAFGRRCSRCQKMNHYARCCKSKSAEVRQIEAEDSDSSYERLMVITDSESVRAVEESPQYNKQMFATMDLVRGRSVRFQLDTGETCNVIRRADLPPDQKVEPSATTLSLFNQATLRPEGRCKLRFRNPKEI